MIGDTGNYLALQVKPLDVATPLLQAAKVKQSQMEAQQQQIQMHRDAIGAEARGLATMIDPKTGQPGPGYEEARQEATQRLGQFGILNSPQAQAGWDNTSSSAMGLQRMIAQTTPPALAETTRHDKALEGHSAEALDQTRKLNAAQIENMRAQRAAEERKTSLTELQPVKIGTGFGGEEIYGVRDPKTNGYRRIDLKTGQVGQPIAGPQPGSPVPGAQPGVSPQPSDAPGGSVPVPGQPSAAAPDTRINAAGQKYLDENIPKEHHNTVVGLANYEINPTTFSTKGGHRERLIDAASNLAAAQGESYDQKEFGTRSAALKAFATGPQGNAVKSFNVAVDHLATLRELAAALDNGDIRLVNAIRNKFKSEFGADAPGNFDAVKSLVGGEIAKAVVGGNNALEDRKELREPLNNAKSFSQLAGVIDKAYVPLMTGQLKGLKQQYETSTGRKNFESKLSERTRAALLGGEGASSQTGGGGNAGIPPPPPGSVLVK